MEFFLTSCRLMLVAEESCLQNAAVDVVRVDSESELQVVQKHYPFQ
jgi:hypothetical protein